MLLGLDTAAWPLAVSARQTVVRERPRSFRQGLNATRPIEGERGADIERHPHVRGREPMDRKGIEPA
jgi:hypothetical protein